MLLGDFPRKYMKKLTKNENHENSFDNSINNHINVSETRGQVIRSDLDPLYPGTQWCAIKLEQISLGRHIMLDINDIWSETI